MYTIAAFHSFKLLAIPVSFKALRANLNDNNANMTLRMGPVYLLCLILLHNNCKGALKQLILVTPELHGDTLTCKEDDQRAVMRAHRIRAAYLVWEFSASVDSKWIMRNMAPIFGQISCEICERNVRHRLMTVLERWDKAKSTI